MGTQSDRDPRTFERLYDEHRGVVYRIALQMLADPARAQDVVQDVFTALWRRPERFDSARGTLGGYLCVMARSRALDAWREGQAAQRAQERLKLMAECDEPETGERLAEVLELRRHRAIVLRALARIPDEQREAIVMAYWGGLTAEQIAECCGQPVGTVKSRIRLGLLKMRERCAAPLAGAGRAAA